MSRNSLQFLYRVHCWLVEIHPHFSTCWAAMRFVVLLGPRAHPPYMHHHFQLVRQRTEITTPIRNDTLRHHDFPTRFIAHLSSDKYFVEASEIIVQRNKSPGCLCFHESLLAPSGVAFPLCSFGMFYCCGIHRP